MAEWCEDITSEGVVERREGNGPVEALERNPLKGIGARRQRGGQGGELEGLYKPKVGLSDGYTGFPQSQISWDLLSEMSSK